MDNETASEKIWICSFCEKNSRVMSTPAKTATSMEDMFTFMKELSHNLEKKMNEQSHNLEKKMYEHSHNLKEKMDEQSYNTKKDMK